MWFLSVFVVFRAMQIQFFINMRVCLISLKQNCWCCVDVLFCCCSWLQTLKKKDGQLTTMVVMVLVPAPQGPPVPTIFRSRRRRGSALMRMMAVVRGKGLDLLAPPRPSPTPQPSPSSHASRMGRMTSLWPPGIWLLVSVSPMLVKDIPTCAGPKMFHAFIFISLFIVVLFSPIWNFH